MDNVEDIALPGDAFSEWFPLPYRVIFLLIMGIWGWGLNVQLLYNSRISAAHMVGYSRHSPEAPIYHSIYRLASIFTGIFAVSISMYWRFSSTDLEASRKWEILPALLVIILLALTFLPTQILHKHGRYRFLSNLWRISLGGIDKEERFADILLADALTSYAKVLGDCWVAGCMFLTGVAATSKPDRTCGTVIVPLIIAAPYAIRFRQCIIEYFRTSPRYPREKRSHMFNALKYASAFPVIIFSAMQRSFDPNVTHLVGSKGVYRLWLLSVFVNSTFSFYWDVAKDWNLTMLSKSRSSTEYPFGLRPRLIFPASEIYYGAIAIDFLLRGTWSIKLSPHIDQYGDLEAGIFILQFLEIFRRWLWVFFRVEHEFIRSEPRLGSDILLTDFSHQKLDDD